MKKCFPLKQKCISITLLKHNDKSARNGCFVKIKLFRWTQLLLKITLAEQKEKLTTILCRIDFNNKQLHL